MMTLCTAELPEELLLIFTSISQQDPEKEFTVGLQVHGGRQYEGKIIVNSTHTEI